MDLSPHTSLAAFYTAYVEPQVLIPGGAAPRTLDQYRQSVARWEAIVGGVPLAEITAEHCAAFVAGLRNTPRRRGGELSPNTIRKHAVHVQRVLDLAGPAGRGLTGRMAKGLLAEVPYIVRPDAREKPPVDSFTLEEVSWWLDACKLARWPLRIGVEPRVWWQSLIRFLLNVGTRINCTLQLTWAMVREEPGGLTLVVPPEIYKGGKHGQSIPLNTAAAVALKEMFKAQCSMLNSFEPSKMACDTSARLFPWPHTSAWLQHCRCWLLARTPIPAERRFGFHGLRKTLATQLASIDGKLAQSAMGHAAFATTRASYIHPDVLRAALERLPQPEGGK